MFTRILLSSLKAMAIGVVLLTMAGCDNSPTIDMDPSDPKTFWPSFEAMKAHYEGEENKQKALDMAVGTSLHRLGMKVYVAAAEKRVAEGVYTPQSEIKQQMGALIDQELNGLTGKELVDYADAHFREFKAVQEAFTYHVANGNIEVPQEGAW